MNTFLFLTAFLTFVEFNCENLFDFRHDSLKTTSNSLLKETASGQNENIGIS